MSVKKMSEVWDLDISPSRKLVLLAYADHADDDGDNVYPSLGRVAHKVGLSVQQVRRISRGLVADSLMELVESGGGRGRPARYRLTLEKGIKMSPFTPAKRVTSGAKRVTSEALKGDTAMIPEPSIEPSIEPSSSRRDADASPGQFCQYLREELEGADVPLLKGREGRYGKEFKGMLARGVAEDVLYRVCDRIVERWRGDDHRKLTAEQAMEDVVNGRAPKHASGDTEASATPEDRIEAVANRVDLRRYAPLLRRFDFTRPEDPPWPIRQGLGGTDDERMRNLTRIRSIVGRREQGPSPEDLAHQEEMDRLLRELYEGVG